MVVTWDAWKAKPSGRRGAQPKLSDLAIETALTVRLACHLPLRQAEGFLGSLLRLMGVELDVPDHTTLSRRGASLDVSLARLKMTGRSTWSSTVPVSRLLARGNGLWLSTVGRVVAAGRNSILA